MVFSEVCHSCGGCMMVCPENAITEKQKPIGILEIGKHDNLLRVVTGILNPGEASRCACHSRSIETGRWCDDH